MPNIVIICGPTAVGKTDIALRIAKDLNMEIVSCDSMQLYKYMDIGSAKPSREELESVPHHMIDVLDPRDYIMDDSMNPSSYFSVVKYYELAKAAIDDIIAREKTPLIVGGTGLYLDSLIYDVDFAAEPAEMGLREELYEIAESEGGEKLHSILSEIDPESASRIHPNNIKRMVRAIEAAKMGNGIKEFRKEFELREEYNPIMIGLTRDRAELYDRINRRVDILIENGLIDEVRSLMDMGLSSSDYPMKGIGYKELFPYLNGDITLEEAVNDIKTNSRHYAKRQFTWFKRYNNMKWFDLTGLESQEEMSGCAGEIEKWLKTKL